MGARYRKISVQISNDEKFRALTDDAQLVFCTSLLAHQHMTAVGAMRATMEGLASEKRHWPPRRFARAFEELLVARMVLYDEVACCIVLPNFLKHNEPESPNVVRAWPKAFE